MKEKLEGQFIVKSWNEDVVKEMDRGLKVSHATVEQEYSGELHGESHVDYTMVYFNEGYSRFVGIEVFDGSINGKKGSFVIET
ncbi:MAG: DUF3224 domain-containing protein [Spirochaetota bacterium]|nr:DUF3224 domain-containing protein [Spirochaetota bacterium]